jgi:hypothetical protein
VKLKTFRVINCFGFRDSGQITLDSEHNFIYLLGRNSSGKSSVLNGIKYFESGIKPSEQPNFKNFNDSGKTSALVGTFGTSETKLSEEQFEKELIKEFAKINIEEEAMNFNAKLKTLFTTILSTYTELIARINAAEEITVWKTHDEHYHFIESGNKEYEARQKKVAAAIEAAKERDGNFNVLGTMRSSPMTWSSFEDLLFLQTPNIYLFNEKFSLREVLPERIDANWDEKNRFLNTFVGYLGKEEVNRYLASNDPEEREELLLKLRGRVKTLTDKVNQYRANTLNSDLLEITLHDKNGIQITVRTDGKKSYYTHLSDNTKFLFAY